MDVSKKIPMDSKMSHFNKIFSSHFESREPGFLQRITHVLPLSQLTHYNLGMSQPNDAENLALTCPFQ